VSVPEQGAGYIQNRYIQIYAEHERKREFIRNVGSFLSLSVSYLGGDLHIQEQTVECPVARPQAVALGGSSCVIAARERKEGEGHDMLYIIHYS
jgi:hypothetical protein